MGSPEPARRFDELSVPTMTSVANKELLRSNNAISRLQNFQEEQIVTAVTSLTDAAESLSPPKTLEVAQV